MRSRNFRGGLLNQDGYASCGILTILMPAVTVLVTEAIDDQVMRVKFCSQHCQAMPLMSSTLLILAAVVAHAKVAFRDDTHVHTRNCAVPGSNRQRTGKQGLLRQRDLGSLAGWPEAREVLQETCQ